MANLEDIRQILSQIEARLERLEMHWLGHIKENSGEMSTNGSSTLPQFTDTMRAAFVRELTARECDAARWACECLSNEAIASEMLLSKGAVANLLTSVYDKLHATGWFGDREVGRPELVRFMGDWWRE
jgi:DNA-binding NarL/FixJ family response regulator